MQAPALQSPAHALPQAPQFAGSLASLASQPFAGSAEQAANPGLQLNVHASATHDARAFGGAGQTAHAGPQAVASVTALHSGPHAWNCGLHVKPQMPRSHVATALSTAGHFRPQTPQFAMLVSGSTQSFPQRSGAAGEHPFVHANDAPDGAQNGIAGGHPVLHAPQLVAFERSVSHPSAAFALQSAQPGSHVAIAHVPAAHWAFAWASLHGAQLGAPQP